MDLRLGVEMKATPGAFRKARADRSKAEGDVSFTPALVEMLQLFDGSAASYGAVYRQLPPVRTVVDFLADAISSTPLKFYRRQAKGRPEEREHRLARLMRSPNPGLTARRHIFGVAADLLVYGRAYDLYVPPRRGVAESLVPLPPYRVTPKGGDLVQPSIYEFWSPDGSTPVRFAADRVVDWHLYDPEDRRIGASKLQALKAILDEEVEASRNRKGFWANSARTGGWLQYPDGFSLTDDQLKRLRESLQGTHEGAANAGKTGIVEWGGKFTPDGFSPREAEFLEGRRFILEATARVFNLPLPLLSLTETATYASQREFHKQLYVDVLPPWYETIVSEIELQLFPWFTDTDDLYGEFVTEAKLRGDFIDQANVLNTAIGRPWMTVREGRQVNNFDDRDVDTDDELVVPVGPNLALESLAVPLPQSPPALAVVAELPEEGLRRQLVEFFDRQERSVMSKAGAGMPFDHNRWNRELAELIGEVNAGTINLRTSVELAASEPSAVFDELRGWAPAIARDVLTRREVS